MSKFQVEKKGERRRYKPAAWSHQSELTDCVGKEIALATVSGVACVGVLLAADQFSIKIATPAESVGVYFKSSLRGFSTDPATIELFKEVATIELFKEVAMRGVEGQ